MADISTDTQGKSIFYRISILKYILETNTLEDQISPQMQLAICQIQSQKNKMILDAVYFGIIAGVFRRIFFFKYNINSRKFSQNIIFDLIVPFSIINYNILTKYPNMVDKYLSNVQILTPQSNTIQDLSYQEEKQKLNQEYHRKFWTNSQYWH